MFFFKQKTAYEMSISDWSSDVCSSDRYLNRQLEDYATGRRRHPEMELIAKRLSPDHRQAVSAHYASLSYAPQGTTTRTPAPRLYVDGDAERGLVACAACHGFAGEGIGPANPPLGGQPAAYLAAQLEAWRRSERRNDPGNVMLRIRRRLHPREVAALAAYAASLPGGCPRQESRAAHPQAHQLERAHV